MGDILEFCKAVTEATPHNRCIHTSLEILPFPEILGSGLLLNNRECFIAGASGLED